MSRNIRIITVRAKDVKVGDVVLHPARAIQGRDVWREITTVETVQQDNQPVVKLGCAELSHSLQRRPFELLDVQEAE